MLMFMKCSANVEAKHLGCYNKERKFISNLWRNMLVLPDSPECVALRADMKGDQLNSRFQHIHKNKLVKAPEVV